MAPVPLTRPALLAPAGVALAPRGAVRLGRPRRRALARAPVPVLVLTLLGALASGCAALPAAGGGAGRDGPGDPALAALSVEERVRDLPKSRRGNMAEYTVRGRRYRTLDSAAGYRERGVASWYGALFHGRETSSGEPFDMHALTAAHRRLPLPTFVRVTNVANGVSLVVRVNDRGPFVDGRVIDLSYAAALRLGMLEGGTAEVELEALSAHPVEAPADVAISRGAAAAAGSQPVTAATARPVATVTGPRVADLIQLGAFASEANARTLARRAEPYLAVAPRVVPDLGGALWRVRVGPLADAEALAEARSGLASAGIDGYTLLTTTR